MPQYDSTVSGREGEWLPCDLAAKADCKQKGIEFLGIGIKRYKAVSPAPNPPYPVMAEPQNEIPKAGTDNKFPQERKRGSLKEK